MLEDSTSDALVFNHGDQPHRACTPRASENVNRVRATNQCRALEPSLAAGVIGRYDVTTPRMNSSREGRLDAGQRITAHLVEAGANVKVRHNSLTGYTVIIGNHVTEDQSHRDFELPTVEAVRAVNEPAK